MYTDCVKIKAINVSINGSFRAEANPDENGLINNEPPNMFISMSENRNTAKK
jgi:hypothetical protein